MVMRSHAPTVTFAQTRPYAWVGQMRYAGGDQRHNGTLHRAAPFAQVNDRYSGGALCGYRFDRTEGWWHVTVAAVQLALHGGDELLWALCGACLYLGGWPTTKG